MNEGVSEWLNESNGVGEFGILIWYTYNSTIHSDEGLTLETSVFESFTVANLPYRPCDW